MKCFDVLPCAIFLTILGAPLTVGADPAPPPGEVRSIDWTTKGAVGAVQNTGTCSASWAAAAADAIGGASAIYLGRLQDLSIQQLVDCSRSYGNLGCSGGSFENAFLFVRDKGIAVQTAYPYRGVDGACRAVANTGVGSAGGRLTRYIDVPANSVAQLRAAVAKQPVVAAIAGNSDVIRKYKSGVIQAPECGTNVDTGVLVVGYDMNANPPYFKVKFSRGTGWGDKGYARIGMKDGPGICGIQTHASYPVVSK